MAGNKVTIRFLADVDGINKGVNQVNQQLGGFQKGLKNIGGMVAGAFAVSKVLDFGAASITAASDLAEMESKVNQVFGASGKAALDQWAQSADTAMGLTQTAALDAASQFGILGDAAGLTGNDLLKFSEDFTQLAADMASFSNTSVPDALQAIQSGLRGEAEPLRKYGVMLDDATLKQAAMELGIYSGTGALTSQQKILAAQKAIYDKTSKAQGDFARTSDGLANQMRSVTAEAGNLQIIFGQSLLKGFGDTTDAAKNMSSVIEQAKPYVKQLGEEIGTLGGLAVTAAGYIIGLNDQITKLTALGDNSTGFSFLQGSIGFISDTADRLRILAGVWTENQVATNEAKAALDGVDGTLVRTGDLAWSTSDAYTVAAQSANDFAGKQADAAAATKTASDNLKILTDGLAAYNKGISITQTNIDFERWQDTVNKQWDKGTKSLNDNTEAGRKNIETILAGATTIGNGYQARLDAGWTPEAAGNWALRRFDKIRETAIAHGFDPATIDKILNVPGFTASMTGLEGEASTIGNDIGTALGQGIVTGIRSYYDYIYNAGFSAVHAAEKGGKAAGMIKSPSKVWEEMGGFLADGLVIGMKDHTGEVSNAASNLMDAANAAVLKKLKDFVKVTNNDLMAQINGGMEGITIGILEGADKTFIIQKSVWDKAITEFQDKIKKQQEIVKQGLQAIESMATGIVSTIMGKVRLETTKQVTDEAGKTSSVNLSAAEIAQSLLASISKQNKVVEAVVGGIGNRLSPELLNMILNLDSDAAIAMADYLGKNPDMLDQLNWNYQGLATYTYNALGKPMGEAWAKIGKESASTAIANAQAQIDADSQAFTDWVASKLNSKVVVHITYVEDNQPPQILMSGNAVAAAQDLNFALARGTLNNGRRVVG